MTAQEKKKKSSDEFTITLIKTNKRLPSGC